MIRLPNKNIPFLEVQDLTERDLIPNKLRVEGMRFVYVKDNQKIFYLKNGITNSDWVELGAGGSTFFGQIDNKELLSNYGAEDGYLFQAINDETIYQFVEDGDEYTVDNLSVIYTSSSGSSKWIGISGKYKYYDNDYDRIDIIQKNWYVSATQYPLNSGRFENRIYARFTYFNQYETKLNKIVFWEIIRDDGVRRDGLRFNTLADLRTYINTNIISDDGGIISNSFIIRGYLKLRKDQYSLNKLVSYNGFISNIKGRYNLLSQKVCTLKNIYDSTSTFWSLNDNLLNQIYWDFLSVQDADLMSNTRSTIGIPKNPEKMYKLIPTKFAKGRIYYYGLNSGNSCGRMLYDSVDGVVKDWDIYSESGDTLYFYDSRVYSQYDSHPSIYIASVGEYPNNDQILHGRSSIRVYHLVDNINNPRYHYFMIKPIGVDCFVIPYHKNFTSSSKVGVLMSNSVSKVTVDTITPISTLRNNDVGNNALCILEKNDYRNVIKRSDTNIKSKLNFFVYDENSGYILSMSEPFSVLYKTNGSPIKILPDRTKRETK